MWYFTCELGHNVAVGLLQELPQVLFTGGQGLHSLVCHVGPHVQLTLTEVHLRGRDGPRRAALMVGVQPVRVH